MPKDYWHNACPLCGRPKYHTAKLCLACRTARKTQAVSKHRKEPCPVCGQPKLVTAQVCRRCYTGQDIALTPYRAPTKADLPSPDWSRVTRDFLLQFAGIFMSEGCLHARLSRDRTLSLSLAIKLRLDDKPCLAAIQAVLGGALHEEHRQNHSPCAVWSVTKREDVRAILTALQPLVVIPMKKAREFAVALEYLAWRDTVGCHHVDRARVAAFQQRLAELKRFSS